MTGRLRDLVLALLVAALAAGAGLGTHALLTESRTPGFPPVGDRVQRAADAIAAGDRVYVAEDAHDLLSPEAEARLEAQAATTDIPVYIAVWEASSAAGYDSLYGAVYQLERLVDEEAVFVLYTEPGTGAVVDSLEVPLLGDVPEDFNGDAERRLGEIVTAVGEARRGAPSDFSYWGGTGGAIAAGLLFGALAIPVVLLLIGLARLALRRRFRMIGGWW